MLFVRETRPKVMETMPEIAPLDIMKEVGRRWGVIEEEELEKYKQLAMLDLQRYKREHQTFVEQINQQRKMAYENLQKGKSAQS
jgi:hypothetical protein